MHLLLLLRPDMRIRKRQAVAEAETPLPISWKYQKLMEQADMDVSPGSCGDVGTVCKGATQNHGDRARRPESELHGDHLQKQEHPLLKQVGCGGDAEEVLRPELPKESITNKHRLKRRKIKHESGSGKSNVTAGNTRPVTDMVKSVSNRTQDNLGDSLDRTARRHKRVMNSKDALVSSIFDVFEAAGENGLTASEVVKIMTEQALPGLKEGGARHTVQVANVLRSSLSFISVGNKRYHLCSSLDPRSDSGRQGRHGWQQKSPEEAPRGRTPQEIKPVHRLRQGQAIKSSRSSKLERGDTSRHATTQPSRDVNVSKPDTNSMLEGGDKNTDVVKPRRRGPLVSQKDKGRTQCKRYDGRGWQCSRLTEPGYSLCVHHQDLINKRAAKLKEAQGSGKVMDRSLLMRVKIVVDSDSEGAEYEEINDPMATLNSDSVPAVPVQKRKMLFLTAIK